MNDEVLRIKKQNPIISLLDKAFEDELGISYSELYEQGKTRFLAKCRIIYTDIVGKIASQLTVIEIGKLINRSHSVISWSRKKYYDLIKYDKSFKEMYERVYHKFNQLKREKENGMG